MRFTEALGKIYTNLWNTMRIIKFQRLIKQQTEIILKNKARYESVSKEVGIPWDIIAVIHSLESSLRFDRHLHNGDSLLRRTVRVPANRPKTHVGPFTWEESAIDALSDRTLLGEEMAKILFFLEGYNGWGYFNRKINSPYLWSGSQHYERGKYVEDGKFSGTAVSKQVGAAVLLHSIRNGFDFTPLFNIKYGKTGYGAKVLQKYLNDVFGAGLVVDGVAGPKTSKAHFEFLGSYLPGDPNGNIKT